jgi:hypothetical protein
MKRFMNKKVATIGLAAGLLLGAGGAAFAYFTATGNGSGTGLTGSTTAWTVNSPTPTGGPLYPDVGAETFAFTVTNNSNGSQGLNAVVATVSPHNAGCDAAWYSVAIDAQSPTATTQTETYGSPINVQVGNNQPVSVVVTLPNLTTVDQSACKGDTPNVKLSAS